MFTRRSPRLQLRRVALVAALAALSVPAGVAEGAKKKKSKPKQPVVTAVRPAQANIGDTITIYGRNFIKGKARNTVVFKRGGKPAVFVKADVSTLRQIRVVLPERLKDHLAVVDGIPKFTKFQIRVLSRRLGKRYTSAAKSPLIGPAIPKAAPGTPGVDTAGEPIPPGDADGDCDGDGAKNGADADDDNDLLGDELEKQIQTDGCKSDSDGDEVMDGYEYRSARDLNHDRGESFTPYPWQVPYPNPLFGDADMDYDGDGLTLLDEYKLWKGHGVRDLEQLNYSDGKQYSVNVATLAYDKQQAFLATAAGQGYSQADLLDMDALSMWDDDDNPPDWRGFPGAITDVERYYFDFDQDGVLSDNERDEDADGLPNWIEADGYMTPEWWTGIYKDEAAFTTPYKGTEIDLADTDGDGVLDGADDQDHDGLPNVREFSRQLVAGEINDGTPPWTLGSGTRPRWLRELGSLEARPMRAWVNPFNPCLPRQRPESRTCPIYVPAENAYPPYDPNDPVFPVKN